MERIPFFRYQHVFTAEREELIEAFLDIGGRGAFILQDEVRHFEARLAEFCGVGHAIGVGNATDGLELVIAAAGIGAGDEVILPSHTFVASAGAVVANGATPVFAEVGTDHLMDLEDAARRVTGRTRALMPTQLNGRTADMDKYEALADELDLILLEDSAQGLGSKFKKRMAGTFGFAGVYSFYPAKTLGALGDGGAIVTNDGHLADLLRERRDHGRTGAGGHVNYWGRNSRLDNLQAAFLLVKLESFPSEIERRREIAARYNANLADLPGVLLPPAPDAEGEHYDVFQNYEMEVDDRDGLRAHLETSGIGTILQWGGRAVHEFERLGVNVELPRTEAVMRRSLLLPMNTSLSDTEVDRVCEVVRDYQLRGTEVTI
jgi:dTDP-4-amino-4,6-dideoxygalactose transaminase